MFIWTFVFAKLAIKKEKEVCFSFKFHVQSYGFMYYRIIASFLQNKIKSLEWRCHFFYVTLQSSENKYGNSMKRFLFILVLSLFLAGAMAKRKATPVYIVAGQSNTDGRVSNEQLPDYIKADKYRHCYWSYGSGSYSGEGRFELFWPHIHVDKRPGRWAYDAVMYYWLEQSLGCDFYVVKESLGGTAIDPRAESCYKMYWCASPEYLDSTAASDKGGKSLLKAFTENIGACIDKELSKHKKGYEIKAFIWHQGESDAKVSHDYYANLKAVIAYVCQYLVSKTGDRRYAELPVLIGSIVRSGRGYSAGVDEAQQRLAREDRNVYRVDVSNATLQSDRMHFDAKGAELLGRKMYNQLVALGLAGKGAKAIPCE